MSEAKIATSRGQMPAYLATPAAEGSWPGVIVIHDALGMSTDIRNQADWLASEGYLAVAPNLYYWGRRIRCLISTVRLVERPLSELDAARRWLAEHDRCTGEVGVIGGCRVREDPSAHRIHGGSRLGRAKRERGPSRERD